MIEQSEITHHIQKHMLGVLLKRKEVRFRDMRPPQTDTNLYSYHLTQLVKSGLVKKAEGGYTLDTAGLVYVDRLNTEKLFVRQQPKIVTMFVIQNSDGDILLQRRNKQPYIDQWSLPHGQLRIEDVSLMDAAKREATEKLNVNNQDVVHAGDCYIRVHYGRDAVISTFVHVFTFNHDDIEINDQIIWARPHKLHTMDLAPGISVIIARTFFRDPFYFEEFKQTI